MKLIAAERAEKVISDWRAAYMVANDRPAPRMQYEHGWCVIRNPYTTRVRLAQVERWTEELNRRAALGPEPSHDRL